MIDRVDRENFHLKGSRTLESQPTLVPNCVINLRSDFVENGSSWIITYGFGGFIPNDQNSLSYRKHG
jgi:hypothetical protein